VEGWGGREGGGEVGVVDSDDMMAKQLRAHKAAVHTLQTCRGVYAPDGLYYRALIIRKRLAGFHHFIRA